MWVKAKLLKCAPAGCFSAMRARPCPPYKKQQICKKREGTGIGGEMCLATVPGIVTGLVSISYWPVFSPVPSNSPRSLLVSIVAN